MISLLKALPTRDWRYHLPPPAHLSALACMCADLSRSRVQAHHLLCIHTGGCTVRNNCSAPGRWVESPKNQEPASFNCKGSRSQQRLSMCVIAQIFGFLIVVHVFFRAGLFFRLFLLPWIDSFYS